MGRGDVGTDGGQRCSENGHIVGKSDEGQEIRQNVQWQDEISQRREKNTADPVGRVEVKRAIIGGDDILQKWDLPGGFFDGGPEFATNPVFLALTRIVITWFENFADLYVVNQFSVPSV